REREAAAHREGLAKHLEAFVTASGNPFHAAAMDTRVFCIRGDHVVEDRPCGFRSQALLKCEVFLWIYYLRDLDDSFIALAQHTGEIEDVLVAHRIGHHGGAVVVRLWRVRSQTLNREATQ